MRWTEKIKKLLEGRNASELATTVGLHKSAIRDAANTGRLPRVDKALKFCRALVVDPFWLFDDSRDWPPPETISGIDLSGRTDKEVQTYLLEREGRILKSAIDALMRHADKEQLDQAARDELFELAKALHLLALSRFAILTNMQDRAMQFTALEQMILHDALGLLGPPEGPPMLESVAPEIRDQVAGRVAEWNRLQEIERRRVHKMIEERRRLARAEDEQLRSRTDQAAEAEAHQRREAEARQRYEAETRRRHEAEVRQRSGAEARQRSADAAKGRQRRARATRPPAKPKPEPTEEPADHDV